MNVKMPDFDPKKIVSFMENTFSRAVQATEEMLGTTEKIELDAHYENLLERAKITKNWTTKLILDTEAVLTPNPGNRVEDYICQKIDVDSKSNRLSNIGYLGMDMIKAGEEFGSESDYGRALIKVGHTEQKLGQCEWDFITSAEKCYIQPLKKFLDGEMKAISNETKILQTKRLDLGVCKNRVKKARSMLGQKTAECDLRVAQSKFDRQADITKLLLEGMDTYQANHLRNLHAFAQSQVRYYGQCMKIMNDLQRELASLGGPTPYEPVGFEDDRNDDSQNPDNHVMKRARVLCSYDAKDGSELNLTSNEVIFVWECNPPNSDYMHGKQGLIKGLVPRAFLELLQE